MTNISVVIPAFNEEKRIRQTLLKIIGYLKSKGLKYEIIIVIDGPAEETLNIIKDIDPAIQWITNSSRVGKGAAVKKGVMNAKYGLILTTDADLSTPIETLDKFLAAIDKADIIIGDRSKNPGPFHRKLMGKMFNGLSRILSLAEFKDTQCGFKLYKKDAAIRIFSKQKITGFAFDVEVLLIAKQNGYKVEAIPVIFDNAGDSKLSIARHPIQMFGELGRIIAANLSDSYRL